MDNGAPPVGPASSCPAVSRCLTRAGWPTGYPMGLPSGAPSG